MCPLNLFHHCTQKKRKKFMRIVPDFPKRFPTILNGFAWLLLIPTSKYYHWECELVLLSRHLVHTLFDPFMWRTSLFSNENWWRNWFLSFLLCFCFVFCLLDAFCVFTTAFVDEILFNGFDSYDWLY